MTREEMWKDFENQLITETRTPVTMSYDDAEILIKLGIKETVAKWKRRLEQTRWIPVERELPEEGEDVLVYIERNAWDEDGFRFKKKCIDIGWHIDGRWHCDGCNGVVGIAWMPLPPSYEPQESEDAK